MYCGKKKSKENVGKSISGRIKLCEAMWRNKSWEDVQGETEA